MKSVKKNEYRFPRSRIVLPFYLLVLSGLFYSCSSPASPTETTQNKPVIATGWDVSGFEGYDQAFPSFMNRWDIPGASVAVAYQGKIVFLRGYGVADQDSSRPVYPDTPFRVMSVTKIFTAALVMSLVEKGNISLSQKVFSLLAYSPTGDSRLADISVQQLLSHTAGWQTESAPNPIVGGRGFNPIIYQRKIALALGVAPPATNDTLIRYMCAQPLQTTPGTHFSYSPFGYQLLGRVIEKAGGYSSYVDALKAFTAPVYMDSLDLAGSQRVDVAPEEACYYDGLGAPLAESQFDGSRVPAPYAYSLTGWDSSGGLKMSALDCLRGLLALEGKNGLGPLVQPETLVQMRTSQGPNSPYGWGWFTSGACGLTNFSGHGGGSWGTKTWALKSADGNWHVVVFLNSLPTSAFSGNQFEIDAGQTIDRLSNALAGTWADQTWTTLTWKSWKKRWGLGASVLPLDDPNQDGLPLLMEYASGLSPAVINTQKPAVLQTDDPLHKKLVYQRIPLDSEILWTVETSSDGIHWKEFKDPENQGILQTNGTVQVQLSLGNPAGVRLKVTLRKTGDSCLYSL